MLPVTPPRSTATAVKRGDTGWAVFCVQRGVGAVPDGDFGPNTEQKLKEYQLRHSLKADGIAGPASQNAISLDALRIAEGQVKVPAGLMRGLAITESGMYLGAVNWAVPGGVDCGLVQHRVYSPFSAPKLKEAFDPAESATEAARTLAARAHDFGGGEPGWRLAALAHNWPAGAADIARDGALADPTGIASWVPLGTRFPDGVPVRTRMDWCEFYALGGRHGEGMVTRFVSKW